MNKNHLQFLAFPKNFLWGVSTSPHQIEGGNKNDWTEWESSPERLSDLKARGDNIADYRSGLAANSWALYEQDFNLVEELNCGAYRLGVEWSRIEPELGVYNNEAIEHYRTMLKSLKLRKIKVVLTLWHWTNPLWLAKIGGWSNLAVVDYFERFVELCVEEFGEYVDLWLTLNEPMMIIGHGYMNGKFPPNHKNDLYGSIKLFNNFAAAHKLAYKTIHKKLPEAEVGLAMTTGYFDAVHPNNLVEKAMVKIADYVRNFLLLKKIGKKFDFIGVNYYHHDRLTWRPPFKANENKKLTDFGWEIYPEGIYHVLKNYAKFKKPLYITENGLADAADKDREQFIKDHLAFVQKAIADGADVRGYFYWSLIDNFEWADGYWPKFGLYSVDRKTFVRTARPSAASYAKICQENGFWLL
jgi:beta-glucosidase